MSVLGRNLGCSARSILAPYRITCCQMTELGMYVSGAMNGIGLLGSSGRNSRLVWNSSILDGLRCDCGPVGNCTVSAAVPTSGSAMRAFSICSGSSGVSSSSLR